MREFTIRLLADGSLILLVIIGGGALVQEVYKRRSLMILHLAAMAGLTSLLFGKLLSIVYQPSGARPFIEAGTQAGAAFIDNPGFPSDHTLLGMVLVAAVYGLTRRRYLSLMLLGVLILMSIARVAALVHTPLDVIAGCALGLIGAVWYRYRDIIK